MTPQRSQRMRPAEIRREAARNLATGTSHALLLAVTTAVLICGLSILELSTIRGMISTAQQFQQRGGSIMILTAENSINGRLCDLLADQPGVQAAGALSTMDTPLRLGAIPNNPLTHFTASPGFATMLPAATGQQHPGLLLPEAVADDLGLRVGDPLPTASGPTVLGGTYDYPDDGRPPGMGYAAISPTSADHIFDACWIDAYPVGQATTDLLYTTVIADSSLPDSGPKLTQHNTTLGKATEPAHAYTARTSAWYPVAGFILGSVIGAGAIWLRRLEIASALHSGIRKTDQLAIFTLETAAWASVAALTAAPLILISARYLAYADHPTVTLTTALIPAMTCAGTLLGVLAAALSVRERRLFAYFKGR